MTNLVDPIDFVMLKTASKETLSKSSGGLQRVSGGPMALFLILCTDKPGTRDLGAATRPAHLAYLSSGAVEVKLGGPWLDEGDGGPQGSMLLIEAGDIAAARAFAAADPYASADLFETVEVRPWRLVVGAFG